MAYHLCVFYGALFMLAAARTKCIKGLPAVFLYGILAICFHKNFNAK